MPKVTIKRYKESSDQWENIYPEISSHSSSESTYGAGTSLLYGHVKLGSINQTGATAADGIAAPNGHTHTTNLTSDSGTSSITLAYNGKYKLSSGGTDVIFTTPPSELFWCTYGSTTYQKISDEIAAGKLPVCIYNNIKYVYVGLSTTNRHTFASQLFDSYRYVSVNNTNSWGAGVNNFEVTSNKVTTITSASTNTQYPSAKAVYDSLQLKQDTLIFDYTPIEDSANPVTSDGIYNAIEDVREVAEGKTTSYVVDDTTQTEFNSQDSIIHLIGTFL